MANGRVVIELDLDTSNAKEKLKGFGDSFSGGSGGNRNGGLFGNLMGGVKGMLGIGIAAKVVSTAMNTISSSVGGAVKRVDTLNQFPKMMSAMGYSANDAKKSINKLSDGIDGLPTALDEVVATTQQIALITGDLGKATDLTIALNNAFLSSGMSAGDASRGLRQFSQMLAAGKVDIQSWRTLQETMPIALDKTAKAFGFTGESAITDFYDALKSGEITFDQFSDKLIELNDEAGGFAETAKIGSEGIATSWKNIGTAVTRGVGNMINSLDKGMQLIGLGSIAKNFDRLKDGVDKSFNGIVSGMDKGFKAIKSTTDFVKKQFGPTFKKARKAFSDFIEPMSEGFSDMNLSLKRVRASLKIAFKQMLNGDYDKAFDWVKKAGGYFKDLGQAGIEMAKGMQENIFKALNAQSWGEVSQKITSKILEGISNIGKKASEAGKAIQDWIFNSLDAQSWGQVAGKLATKIGDNFTERIKMIQGAGKAIKDWIFKQTDSQSWGEVGSKISEKIADSVKFVGSNIKDFTKEIKEWVFEKLNAQSWGDVGAKLGELLGKGIDLGINTGKNLFSFAKKIQSDIAEEIGKIDWHQASYKFINSVGDFAKGLYQGVDSAIQKHFGDGKLGMKLNALGEAIFEPTSDFNVSASKFTNAVFDALNGAVDGLAKQVLGFSFSEVKENIEQAMKILENIEWTGDFNSVAEDIGEALETAFSTNLGEQLFEPMKQDIETTVSGLLQFFEGKKADIQRGMKEMWNFGGGGGSFSGGDSGGSGGGSGAGGFGNDLTSYMNQQRQTINTGMSNIKNDMTIHGQEIEIKKGSLFSGLGNIIQNGWNAITGMFNLGGQNTVASAQGTATGVETASMGVPNSASHYESFASNSANAVNGMQGSIPGVLASITASANSEGSAIEATRQYYDNLSRLSISATTSMNLSIGATYGLLRARITSESQSMETAMKTAFNNIRQNTTSSMNSINSAVTSGMAKVLNAVKTGMTNSQNAVNSGFNNIKSSATNGMNGVNSVVSSGMNRVVSTIRSSMSSAVSAMNNASGQAQGAGYNMGVGFYNGLSGMAGSIISLAYSIASRAAAAMRSALRIHSPSLVTRALGVFTGQGLALGIEDETRNVEKASNLLAEKAIPAIPRVDMNTILGLNGAVPTGGFVNNSSHSSTLNIENFYNNDTKTDIKRLMRDMDWVERQTALGGV